MLPIPDPYNANCPSRLLLSDIADKWTLLLLPLLAQGPQRTGELKRKAEGISQKMLTQTLRTLEQNGLVERRDYQTVPPKVDYRLTRLGRSLSDLLAQIDDWVVANYVEVREAQAKVGVLTG
ncbi:MAG: helix-turn-helix domain-containing protein [Erythrobacter sp.]